MRYLLSMMLLMSGVAFGQQAMFNSPDTIFFHERYLTLRQAAALAKFRGEYISLDDLLNLDAKTAKVLAKFRGDSLSLDLPNLNPETAAALAQFQGRRLGFGSKLAAIDEPTATALAQFSGESLGFSGLTRLDANVTKALLKFDGSLGLGGLSTLDAATAKELAKYRGWNLDFRGIKFLDPAAALALAEYKGTIYLQNLHVDAETAASLAELQAAHLWLGVFVLNAEVVDALNGFKGGALHLNQFAVLDGKTTKALAGFEGNCLTLEGLTTTSAEGLAALKANPRIQLPERFR